jgi:hypothetical protein
MAGYADAIAQIQSATSLEETKDVINAKPALRAIRREARRVSS